MDWEKAQKWEAEWWGNCINTYGEEEKQLVYAQKMGLQFHHSGKSPYNIDLGGRSVIDIGGGVVSLLLKCTNRREGCVVADPILKNAPKWVIQRYIDNDILPIGMKAEEMGGKKNWHFDEAWIYNCLQHTEDPEKIIRNARKISKIIRIFEWVDTHINEGHPHSLTEAGLNTWLGGEGKIEILNLPTLRGKCYYGIFKGDRYKD